MLIESFWVDRFKSWRKDLQKRVEAGQEDINMNLLVGANLIAEAFTRPKVMHQLAKVGFSQPYIYFARRTSSESIGEFGQNKILTTTCSGL